VAKWYAIAFGVWTAFIGFMIVSSGMLSDPSSQMYIAFPIMFWIIGLVPIASVVSMLGRQQERALRTAAVAAAAAKAGMMVRTYRATTEDAARLLYEAEAPRVVATGYNPVAQQWVSGDRGPGPYLLGLFLSLWLIGIPILVYLLVKKPEGSLLVTFERRSRGAAAPDAHPAT